MSSNLIVPTPAPVPTEPKFVLSLSGGGTRGLFAAYVLEALENESGRSCREIFDVICGTSVGGILAAGLACGVSAKVLRVELESNIREIFARHWLPLRGWFFSQYGTRAISDVIKNILPTQWESPLSNVQYPLLIIAVELNGAMPVKFRSGGLASGRSDRKMTLRDAVLATTAAPTYFPPHQVEGIWFIDGGIAANTPTLLAIDEVCATFGVGTGEVWALSIGTAASRPYLRHAPKSPGRIGWMSRYQLIDLIFCAQESLIDAQAMQVLGNRYLRIDRVSTNYIALDSIHRGDMMLLQTLAREATTDQLIRSNPVWERVISRSYR